MCNFLAYLTDWYLMYFLQNGSHWWYITIRSANALVPGGIKALTDLMLTQIYDMMMTSFATNRPQWVKNSLSHCVSHTIHFHINRVSNIILLSSHGNELATCFKHYHEIHSAQFWIFIFHRQSSHCIDTRTKPWQWVIEILNKSAWLCKVKDFYNHFPF